MCEKQRMQRSLIKVKKRGIDNLLMSRLYKKLMCWVSHQCILYEAPGVHHHKSSLYMEIKTQWEEKNKDMIGSSKQQQYSYETNAQSIRKQRKKDTQLPMTHQWCYDYEYYSLKSTWNQINTHSWLLCHWNNFVFLRWYCK